MTGRVFAFVRIRHEKTVDGGAQRERSLSTLSSGSCSEAGPRYVSFDAALLYSLLCLFLLMDGETL